LRGEEGFGGRKLEDKLGKRLGKKTGIGIWASWNGIMNSYLGFLRSICLSFEDDAGFCRVTRGTWKE
jgi:hypothetical protein